MTTNSLYKLFILCKLAAMFYSIAAAIFSQRYLYKSNAQFSKNKKHFFCRRQARWTDPMYSVQQFIIIREFRCMCRWETEISEKVIGPLMETGDFGDSLGNPISSIITSYFVYIISKRRLTQISLWHQLRLQTLINSTYLYVLYVIFFYF